MVPATAEIVAGGGRWNVPTPSSVPSRRPNSGHYWIDGVAAPMHRGRAWSEHRHRCAA